MINQDKWVNSLPKTNIKFSEDINQIDHNKSLENREIEVLVENEIKDQKKYFGRNKYFNSVIFSSDRNDIGKIVKVNIENSNQNTLFGKTKIKMKAA